MSLLSNELFDDLLYHHVELALPQSKPQGAEVDILLYGQDVCGGIWIQFADGQPEVETESLVQGFLM